MPKDCAKVIVDTTVQEMAVAFPTDVPYLMHRARERLVRLAKKHGVALRQSDGRIGKHVLIARQRYAHAKQRRHAGKAFRKIRTFLGRVERDRSRSGASRDSEALRDVFRRIHSIGQPNAMREQR